MHSGRNFGSAQHVGFHNPLGLATPSSDFPSCTSFPPCGNLFDRSLSPPQNSSGAVLKALPITHQASAIDEDTSDSNQTKNNPQ